jgi:Mn-dependent DtxR family transcriptional regulator
MRKAEAHEDAWNLSWAVKAQRALGTCRSIADIQHEPHLLRILGQQPGSSIESPIGATRQLLSGRERKVTDASG